MIVCLRTVGVPAEERRLRRFAGAAPMGWLGRGRRWGSGWWGGWR